MKHPLLIALCLLLVLIIPTSAQEVRPLDLSQQSFPRANNLGITFIAYTNDLGRDANRRYRQALEMGAGWNRYPLYWDRIERAPGVFDWGPYDQLVELDHTAGIQTNAILLGNPNFYGPSSQIAGLYEPIFTDGTDISGTGKAINPNNPWARFVFEAVNRYRPGGVLARERRWPAGGITVWEAWNEPDFEWFWTSSVEDYARLLKITYITVKYADPNAKVMFGGLAFGNPDTNNWLQRVLDIYTTDPTRAQYNWYMDIVGIHSYNEARRTGLVVTRVKNTLANYGLVKPIWVNETGIPVWDDYPGPLWAADSPAERRLRGTQEQQAAFVIQSAAYAFAAGAEKVFFHQLYDDCGNEGGNHSPESRGAGDAYGFYRNPAGSECFSQHPNPGTPRISVNAFRTLVNVFGDGNFTNGSVRRRIDGSVFITFDRLTSNERIVVFWNDLTLEKTIQWPAESTEALVYTLSGERFRITPTLEETYVVTLPPARLNDDPQKPPGQLTAIGGEPFILFERVTRTQLAGADLSDAGQSLVTPRAPLPGQIGSILGDSNGNNASLNMSDDINPPITGMESLPEVSPATFTVKWNGADAGGIEKYLVWVRVNDADWGPWLETTRTSAEYSGAPGNTYAFAVWAVDNAGNWSLNTDLQPQAITRVQ